MYKRLAASHLDRALARSPAVAILGPRQVGKTTLAREAAASRAGSVFLDLETAADLAKLTDPARYLSSRRDRLLVLDEVQNAPGLFSELRAEGDAEGATTVWIPCNQNLFVVKQVGLASQRLTSRSEQARRGRSQHRTVLVRPLQKHVVKKLGCGR